MCPWLSPPVPAPRGRGAVLTRVTVGPDGLVAQCPPCGTYLEQCAGQETAAALRAFLQAHPSTRHVRHSAVVPTGWRTRAVGTLSQ